MDAIARDANARVHFLLVDANGYLEVVNSAELPAGTQVIGSVKITDGTTEAQVVAASHALKVAEQGTVTVTATDLDIRDLTQTERTPLGSQTQALQQEASTYELKVKEQGTPVVHAMGLDTATWRGLRVDSSGNVYVLVS